MADIFDKIVAEQQSAAAASQPASQAVPPTQTSAQTASSKPAGDIFDQVVAGTAKDPWDNPAPSNSGQAAQPSILSRALSGAGQSLENNFVEPAKAAYKAVVEPPSTSAEQLAHATGGDLGLAAFRAGKAVVDSVQNLTQAPKENYEQAKQDVQRAVNDFHNKDYRNAASSVGSTAADIVGMVPGDVNSLAATRARELTEGARPGGDLATPLAKDVTDIAGMALADRVFFKDSNGGVHSVPHDQLDAALKIDPKLRILEKAKGFTKFAMPDKPELETVPAPDMGKVVETEKPVSDATIVKKMGGKKLSEGARQTFKEHAGDTIPAGSSPQNHIYKAVRPVNETIATQGKALDNILQTAQPFNESPMAQVDENLHDLRENFPGGMEDQFGKAVDKERLRYDDALKSNDPKTINETIRDLDERINNYSSPEDPIETSTQAQDAARVIMRRTLRDTLNNNLPETKPINTILGKNLELRNWLRDRLGNLANNPDAADALHNDQIELGRKWLDTKAANKKLLDDYNQTVARVKRNRGLAWKIPTIALGGAGVVDIAKKLIGD